MVLLLLLGGLLDGHPGNLSVRDEVPCLLPHHGGRRHPRARGFIHLSPLSLVRWERRPHGRHPILCGPPNGCGGDRLEVGRKHQLLRPRCHLGHGLALPRRQALHHHQRLQQRRKR